MGKLDGKVALITGSGSGLGRATALLFAKEGAKVVVADCAPAGGQETVRMIKETGGEAVFIESDVSKAADAERMVKTAVDTYERIDILYNNAGIEGTVALTAELTEEDWDRVIDTNLKGVFLGSKYAIPVMLNQGGGVIINTASVAGLVGSAERLPYCASKAGVIHSTKTMAVEYARQNIRVNCICPGLIQTPQSEYLIPADDAARQSFMQSFPFRRMGRPDEIAQAALFLASDSSSFVNGATLVVDSGSIASVHVPRPSTR